MRKIYGYVRISIKKQNMIDRFRIFSLEDTCAMLSSTEIKNPIHAPTPFGFPGGVKRFLFE